MKGLCQKRKVKLIFEAPKQFDGLTRLNPTTYFTTESYGTVYAQLSVTLMMQLAGPRRLQAKSLTLSLFNIAGDLNIFISPKMVVQYIHDNTRTKLT